MAEYSCGFARLNSALATGSPLGTRPTLSARAVVRDRIFKYFRNKSAQRPRRNDCYDREKSKPLRQRQDLLLQRLLDKRENQRAEPYQRSVFDLQFPGF